MNFLTLSFENICFDFFSDFNIRTDENNYFVMVLKQPKRQNISKVSYLRLLEMVLIHLSYNEQISELFKISFIRLLSKLTENNLKTDCFVTNHDINSFLVTGLFLYPLKTPQNVGFFR